MIGESPCSTKDPGIGCANSDITTIKTSIIRCNGMYGCITIIPVTVAPVLTERLAGLNAIFLIDTDAEAAGGGLLLEP